MFGWAKNTYHMSEAAVVAQSALEISSRFSIGVETPQKLANKLVAASWNTTPDIFNGKRGVRPHKVSAAAISLAGGLKTYSYEWQTSQAIFLALGTILIDVNQNEGMYAFSDIDRRFIDASRRAYIEFDQEKRSNADKAERQRKIDSTKPEMSLAAKGFSSVAILRRANLNPNFHDLEMEISENMSKNGASDNFIYSARWGSVCASQYDMDEYERVLSSVSISLKESQNLSASNGDANHFEVAAQMCLERLIRKSPKDYANFLVRIEAI